MRKGYERFGIEQALPGLQRAIEILQAELDELRARIARADPADIAAENARRSARLAPVQARRGRPPSPLKIGDRYTCAGMAKELGMPDGNAFRTWRAYYAPQIQGELASRVNGGGQLMVFTEAALEEAHKVRLATKLRSRSRR